MTTLMVVRFRLGRSNAIIRSAKRAIPVIASHPDLLLFVSQRNSTYVLCVFGGAFFGEKAVNAAGDGLWGSFNRGVRLALLVSAAMPPGLRHMFHFADSGM